MIIEINFKAESPNEYIDFIELTDGKKIFVLDWDLSEIRPGNIIGRGVYINESYGNGRLYELRNMWFSHTQAYDPLTQKERTNVIVTEIVIFDGNKRLNIPLSNLS